MSRAAKNTVNTNIVQSMMDLFLDQVSLKVVRINFFKYLVELLGHWYDTTIIFQVALHFAGRL